MKVGMLLISLLLLNPLFAEDAKKNVKAIVDSVTKNSEKPLIEQDNFCPVCPADQLKKYEECSKDVPLSRFEEKAKLDKGGVLLIPGKIYEVRMNSGDRARFIVGKSTAIKYFSISKDGKEFSGLVPVKSDSPDDKFIRDYEKLENVYNEAKFKELCQYLGTNREKYAKLKGTVKRAASSE